MPARAKYALQAAFTEMSLALFTELDLSGVEDGVQERVGLLLEDIVTRHLAAADADGPDEQPLVDLLERLEGGGGWCRAEGETHK